MGLCWCRLKKDDENTADSNATRNHSYPDSTPSSSRGESSSKANQMVLSSVVDDLVLQTLAVIGTLVNNDQEPAFCLIKLREVAESQAGWIQVICSMVRLIPMAECLGPLVITLVIDDCPLPSKESLLKMVSILNLSSERALADNNVLREERNICVIVGCIAEKMAGANSIAMLTKPTLEYFITHLKKRDNPRIVLAALVALEKFSQTSENRISIKKRLAIENKNPVLILESYVGHEDFLWRQVGFCAQWCLDNLFVLESRSYSYENVDRSHINVMLNTKDVSQYLKISPDGLEARSDSYSFESVRCTYQVDAGCWYYEVLLVTPGVMQIGWATKNSNFLDQEGYGIGDDTFSIAYDGCRRLIWYNAETFEQDLPRWKAGDILGCLLDLDNKQVVFSINGTAVGPCNHVFQNATSGFFAAASFMSFQQCRFNFGSEPFKFPPEDRPFSTFNDHATLSDDQKEVIPKHICQRSVHLMPVKDDACSICCSEDATIVIEPCQHRGFCSVCVSKLKECPMCRGPIQNTRLEA